MPTIRDVAKRAGVATMTVSRVINNSDYVSETTRAKVEAAITELGYVPNMLGPSLRFDQTNTLAVILTDITNPFWTTVARGVEDAAHQASYSVILCNTDESLEKQEQYLHMLLKRRIDGILFVPAENSPAAVQLIRQQKIGFVVLDRHLPGEDIDIVRGDSLGGAYNLTRHLIDLGHQNIAVISGPKDISTSFDRVAGFQKAMEEADIRVREENIYWGSFNWKDSYRMAMKALSLSPPPTALMACNYFIAIGALKALSEVGLRIPEDISMVSFDDVPDIINPYPFLTVAIQEAYEMGFQATELLIARLRDEGPEEGQRIILPTKLLIRHSTAPPSSSNQGY